MTGSFKFMITLTCGWATGIILVSIIMCFHQVPLPEGAQLICDYENGWRVFSLNGKLYLLYSEWRGFGGYTAITQIHGKSTELTGGWVERDGVLEFEKEGK